MRDPRPLTSEPLALDLLNTAWIEDGRPSDLLDSEAGVELWLEGHGSPLWTGSSGPLLAARAAIRAVLERREDPRAAAELDAVLQHGRLRLTLGDAGPRELVEVSDAWRVPWLAARDALRLLARGPDRVRTCANPDCALWFEDTTRPGSRRWCSMSACGNRLKARRHHRRSRAS